MPYGSYRPQLPTQEHPSLRTGTLVIADADVNAPLEYTTWKTPPNNFLLFNAGIQDVARQVLRPYFAQVVDLSLDFESWYRIAQMISECIVTIPSWWAVP